MKRLYLFIAAVLACIVIGATLYVLAVNIMAVFVIAVLLSFLFKITEKGNAKAAR